MNSLPFLTGRILTPSTKLRNVIHRYEWFETDKGLDDLIIPLFPNLSPSFAFLFYGNNRIVIQNKQIGEKEISERTLIPPNAKICYNQKIKNLRLFRVIFQPGALYALYGIPVSELQQGLIDFSVELDSDLAILFEEMAEYQQINHCIALFEAYLMARLGWISTFRHSLFQSIFQVLNEFEDGLAAYQLASELNLSTRHLNRKMKQEFGFSSKLFLRIYRFCQVLQYIHKNPQKPLVQIAVNHGYFDQAHFSNEFKEMTGLSPKRYVNLLIERDSHQIEQITHSGLLIKKS